MILRMLLAISKFFDDFRIPSPYNYPYSDNEAQQLPSSPP
jgi:hypothetical protein